MDTKYVTQRIQIGNSPQSTRLRKNGGKGITPNGFRNWNGRIGKVTAWIIVILWFLASCWYQHAKGLDVNVWRY